MNLFNYFLQRKKVVARVLLLIFLSTFWDSKMAYALTTGPSQPEMQSFEPVGTTDMVNMFSGDFNYNIPLLDIEGYPVNISYHSNISMEQEASWVGLGWNINPGNINHGVRGFSDDYNGETIKKELEIEKETSQSVGLFMGMELGGIDKLKGASDKVKKNLKNIGPSAKTSFGLTFNNYNGVSASVGQSFGARIPKLSTGVNLGATVSTDKGTDYDYSLSYSGASKNSNFSSMAFSFSGGLNSREGLTYTSFGVNASFGYSGLDEHQGKQISGSISEGFSTSSIPIGMQNFVPVITNAASASAIFVQLKVGGEVYFLYPYIGGSFSNSEVEFENTNHRQAYGYFNLENANPTSMVDFTRDKDGLFNRKSYNLPLSNMAYDVYSVSGQGTGGIFRAFRNDIGTSFDPLTQSSNTNHSFVGEVGVGNVAEVGLDGKNAFTSSKSGPWNEYYQKYQPKVNGNTYEPFYFKQAGELARTNKELLTAIADETILNFKQISELLNGDKFEKRTPRSNLLYFKNGEQASLKQVSTLPKILNYNGIASSNFYNSTPSEIERINDVTHRKNLANEFTQLLPDGRRYIYGIPAMNLIQREMDFSTSVSPNTDNTVNMAYVQGSSKPVYTSAGLVQGYYSSTTHPSFAHSYLLTSVLSPDYSDVTGNGITDDDLGSFTKFNYQKKENYIWRAPYSKDIANFNKGLESDCNDNKANVSGGVREQWYLHSIESRNFIAFFDVSIRKDAYGSDDLNMAYSDDPLVQQFLGGTIAKVPTYKLDRITLYSKHDLKKNAANAVPIKKVVFSYDYSLCQGAPNTLSSNIGKLTLKTISIGYGSSDMGFFSPYKFTYGNNKSYNALGKDAWGTYKSPNSNSDAAKGLNLGLNNIDFPYVNQNDPENDLNASSWNLASIDLPSGGKIEVNYEADDYAYVQDKRAMEMFKLEGVGNTENFNTGNKLYEDHNSPNLYIYFKRKGNATDILNKYLNSELLQFNAHIKISEGERASCPGTPLTENVKGYAVAIQGGVCPNNSQYAYLKLDEKYLNTFLGISSDNSKAKVNPISLAAINFARMYNRRALDPGSEILNVDEQAIIKQLMKNMLEGFNFFSNEVKNLLKQGKAKECDLSKSYIRLISQSGIKKGGGSRVSKIEFKDNWTGTNVVNSYGSEYDYTTLDESNNVISSGVASYEPLMGGNENPLRTLVKKLQQSGNDTKFPPVDPVILLSELPLGETFYPSPDVGYSKVSVRSIHHNEGASSQSISVNEYYTSKDFPIVVNRGPITGPRNNKPIDSKKNKFDISQLLYKRDIFKVGQSFSVTLNDMHGKPKSESRYAGTGASKNNLISSKSFEYYTGNDGQLDNTVKVLKIVNGVAKEETDELGVETDITIDSREKEEKTNVFTGHFSSNNFLAPPIPIIIPMVYPGLRKSKTEFSSLTSTKIIQKYGIIKNIKTYDKGAQINLENQVFDSETGQPLITRVNTEHDDQIYEIKYPAYWAYRCMGPAYENIHFEESIKYSPIINSEMFIPVKNPDIYNIGDELDLQVRSACSGNPNFSTLPGGSRFKVWVVSKDNLIMAPQTSCNTICANASNPLMYSLNGSSNNCFTRDDINAFIHNLTGETFFQNFGDYFEQVQIQNFYRNDKNVKKWCDACNFNPIPYTMYFPGHTDLDSNFDLKIYTGTTFPAGMPVPYGSSYFCDLEYTISQMGEYLCGDYGLNPASSQVVFPWSDVAKISIRIPLSSNVPPTICSQSNNIPWLNENYYAKDKYLNSDPLGLICDVSAHFSWRIPTKCSLTKCQVSLRSSQPLTTYLKVIPNKKGASGTNSVAANWPDEQYVYSGKINVVRSGKRNQLGETVQEVSTLDNPILPGNLLRESFGKAINASARTYTTRALVPLDYYDPNNILSEYFNPFVRGELGNYRVEHEVNIHKNRDYTSASIQADRDKGLFSFTNFWKFGAVPAIYKETLRYMLGVGGAGWNRQNTVSVYSPWGVDLEVQDAVGNNHANIMGYNNRQPSAVVSNAKYNQATVENFEDYYELINTYPVVRYINNTLKLYLYNSLNPSTLSGGNLALVEDSHSGKYALQVNSATTMTFPTGISPLNQYLLPFNFEENKKYLIQTWRKTIGTAPNIAGVSFQYPGGNCNLLKKSNTIENWTLYEGVLTVPSGIGISGINMSLTSGILIDDLRIIPYNSNAKSYVFDPITRKLSAVLDENNYATFFEYNKEGKLVRLKKETEKGILTLKESRESLKSYLPSIPGQGNGNGGGNWNY